MNVLHDGSPDQVLAWKGAFERSEVSVVLLVECFIKSFSFINIHKFFCCFVGRWIHFRLDTYGGVHTIYKLVPCWISSVNVVDDESSKARYLLIVLSETWRELRGHQIDINYQMCEPFRSWLNVLLRYEFIHAKVVEWASGSNLPQDAVVLIGQKST